jgi:predicted GTPase
VTKKSLIIDTGGIAQDDTILKEDIAEQAWIAAEESRKMVFRADRACGRGLRWAGRR